MAVKTVNRTITHDDWRKEGIELFGEDVKKWKFVCPACGVITEASEWLKVNAQSMLGFSCIGRVVTSYGDAFSNDGKQPCNYAGGGLFRLNPVTVVFEDGVEDSYFDFYRGGD